MEDAQLGLAGHRREVVVGEDHRAKGAVADLARGGDGVALAGLKGQVGIDERRGGGPRLDDLDVVRAGGEREVIADGRVGDIGQDLVPAHPDVNIWGVRRGVHDADVRSVGGGSRGGKGRHQRQAGQQAHEPANGSQH